MAEDNVSGAEFGRWRQDFSAFQDRLESRLNDGFTGVHDRLDELNGRTRKNSEAVVALDMRVTAIQSTGCGQFQAHRAVLEATTDLDAPTRKWHQDKRIIGPAVGLGVPAALYGGFELIKVVFEYLHHLAGG